MQSVVAGLCAAIAFGFGFAAGFTSASNGIHNLISDRVQAGVMEHDGAGYRILPLEPPRVEKGE